METERYLIRADAAAGAHVVYGEISGRIVGRYDQIRHARFVVRVHNQAARMIQDQDEEGG